MQEDTHIVYTTQCTAKMAVITATALADCVIHTNIMCTKHNAGRVIGLSRLLASEHEDTL